MATLRNKRNLAAMNKENCEELSRHKLAQDSFVPRPQENYITQVSEEIEARVTKKLCEEFSRTKNRILGALSRLDDFFMNTLIQGHSGNTLGTSRNAHGSNQGTTEDDSQSDLHTTHNSGPEDEHHMVTGVHEEVIYCSFSIFSRRQKENRSTSQPQFRSENTLLAIEADQVLLALQQLANNNNSANFHNNFNRISELPKSLTTTTPTFDRKSEKFELFEDLFQTSLKILNRPTEDDRENYFHSLMRGDALQTLKNIKGPT